MPRTARLDTPGTLHHVIIRGIEKGPIIDDDTDRHAFVERLGDLSLKLETPVYAWALMSNHAHMLVRSGQAGLSSFMRKFLTGYAVGYNRRHNRHGHLLQNRYKSIVVEEDAYFMELVRYIHLNPLRAGIVDSLRKLDHYSWSGHSAVLGRRSSLWQDTDYVLRWFDAKQGPARQAYRRFVQKGIEMGKQPHLVGGGLVRSAGGWSEIKAMRRIGIKQKGDERILGSGEFVQKILKEAEPVVKIRMSGEDRRQAAMKMIDESCRISDIHAGALMGGSRRREVSLARHGLALRLTNELGLSFAETAGLLGVSISAIARIKIRKTGK